MTDIFFHICKHVLRCPNMNIDLNDFVPAFEIYDMDNDEWNMYNRFMRPFMYKAHESKEYESEKTKNLFLYRNMSLKLEGYLNMHKDRPLLFSEESREGLNENDGRSFKELINNRNPVVVPQGAIDLYIKCQQHYHNLVKFVKIVKMRYVKAKNQLDLLLRPISENDKNVYVILQANTKYLFRVSEFQQIIVTCIANTEEYFPEMLEIKNPYNNMKITNTILYNFYFHLKTNNYKIDELFSAYFDSSFRSKEYLSKYEVIIRDRAITNEVKYGHHDRLYHYILRMFIDYKRRLGKIHLSCGFPRKELVDIMRPYLHLYLYQLYYPRELPRKYDSEELLSKRLHQLACINPSFGKRTIHSEVEKDGTIKTFAKYNCLVPSFHKPVIISRGMSDYITIDVKNDIQYHKMMSFFKSSVLCLPQLTNFYSTDMEEEYEYYVDVYYNRHIQRNRNTTETREETNQEESENESESDTESNKTVSDCEDTVVDDDENEDDNENNDNESETTPRAPIFPIPYESPTSYQRIDQDLTEPNEPNERPSSHVSPNETELVLNQHDELIDRVFQTLTNVNERVQNMYLTPIEDTPDRSGSSSAMSICETDDDEKVSVVTGAIINNQEEIKKEDDSSETMSSDTDPDVIIVSNNNSNTSDVVNKHLTGKYIVRAMTGSRELGYVVELSETFYTAEVALKFYDDIGLNYYNLKEIEFISIDALNSENDKVNKHIINYEEKLVYNPNNYSNNTEIKETSEENCTLSTFLCDQCNLQSMKNSCYVCKKCDICNYCNGDNVWCKQNEDWICRDCYNNRQQEEYNDEDIENNQEEEIVSSSLMTYGIPANADMPPEEYVRVRMEEMTRDAYIDKGFTEEEYNEMQELRLEEYGSDGEYEDY